MEALGFELPKPDKPLGRYNNRKITFDAACRTMLSRLPDATVWNWMKCRNTVDGHTWKSRIISWQSKKSSLPNRKKLCRSKPSSLKFETGT